MEEYGFTCEGIHPLVKVPNVINLEEISKVFGQAINKNGYSYVHSNNLKFIKKKPFMNGNPPKTMSSIFKVDFFRDGKKISLWKNGYHELGYVWWMDKLKIAKAQ